MAKNWRVGAMGVTGIAVLAAVLGCRRADVAPPVAVRVAELKREPIVSAVRFGATVREQQRIELSFKVPGTVADLLQVGGPDGKPRNVPGRR